MLRRVSSRLLKSNGARMKSKLIAKFLVCLALAGFGLRASLAQQPNVATAPKARPATAAEKAHVAVFSLSGTPAPGPRKQAPKGLPRFQALPKEEKLTIAQGVHGIPK